MKKNLFTILCLVGTLGAAGITSCSPTAGETTSSSSSSSSSSNPDSQKIKFDVKLAKEEGGKQTWTSEITDPNPYGDAYTGITTLTIVKETNVVEKITVTGHLITDGWNQSAHDEFAKFENGIEKLQGKTVEDLLKITADLPENTNPDNKLPSDSYVIAGATQTSKRILLSIDRALDAYKAQPTFTVKKESEQEGKQTWVGEISDPNPYGAPYTGKVTLVIANDTVEKATAEGKLVTEGWSQNATTAFEALKNGIKLIEGKSVTEVLKLTSPLQPETAGNGSLDKGSYIITGATQTSKRILLTVDRILDQYIAAKK